MSKADSTKPQEPQLVIRRAADADRGSIERLAELDSALAPPGPLLLAEVEGGPVAALSLTSGAAIADPFVATADVVELLRFRAAQLRAVRTAGAAHDLSGRPAAAWESIRQAGDWLHRLLERPHVAVQHLDRRQ